MQGARWVGTAGPRFVVLCCATRRHAALALPSIPSSLHPPSAAHLVVVDAGTQRAEEVDGLAGEGVHQRLHIRGGHVVVLRRAGGGWQGREQGERHAADWVAASHSRVQHTLRGNMWTQICTAGAAQTAAAAGPLRTWKMPVHTPMRSSRVGFQ